MINLRQDGIDGNNFSGKEYIFAIEQTGSIKHIAENEFMKEVEGKDILLLVHGFHKDFYHVSSYYLSLLNQNHQTLSDKYDAIVGFIWPSGEPKSDNHHSKENVRKAGSFFRHWIYRLNYVQCTVDVMSNGMGSLVVYHSVQIPGEFAIRNIFSVGAGIPQEVLTNISQMDRIRYQVNHIYVFYTENEYPQEGRLAKSRTIKPMLPPERIKLEKKTTKMGNVSLVNITGLIDCYSGYQSLRFVTELIGMLRSDNQNRLNKTINDVKERISKTHN